LPGGEAMIYIGIFRRNIHNLFLKMRHVSVSDIKLRAEFQAPYMPQLNGALISADRSRSHHKHRKRKYEFLL